MRELTTSLGLLDQVHIAGFVCDVQPFLRASDAFVLSSRWEGLPVGVLEAQAAGLPVVATNGSGTAEAMLDGQTGFLIPVGDVCALTGAMEKMMSLPVTQRQHMGNMARNFVSDRFSLDRILDQWEELYQELLREQPQASRWTRLKFNQSASVEYVKAASAAASVPVAASPPGHTCVDGDSRPPPVRK